MTTYKLPRITRSELQHYQTIIRDYENTSDQYDHQALLDAVNDDDSVCGSFLALFAGQYLTRMTDFNGIVAAAVKGHPQLIVWAANLHRHGWTSAPMIGGVPIYELTGEATVASGSCTTATRGLLDWAARNGKVAPALCDAVKKLPVRPDAEYEIELGPVAFDRFRGGKKRFDYLHHHLTPVLEVAVRQMAQLTSGSSLRMCHGDYVLDMLPDFLQACPKSSDLPELAFKLKDIKPVLDNLNACFDSQGGYRFTLEDTALGSLIVTN